MIELDFSSPVPIFEQIKTGVKGMIAKGTLKPGERIPSIRTLAAKLGINPNTAARSIRELVEEGILEPHRGEGNSIAANAVALAQKSIEAMKKDFSEGLRLALRGGLTWKDIDAIIAAEKGKGA